MRYMNWSYDQFCACPADYIQVIHDEAAREERERKLNAAHSKH